MVYETFLENIRRSVADQLGDSFSVSLQQISKNNGVISDGLCIQKPPSCLSAAIYLGHFFHKHQEGMPISHITDEILSLYTAHSLPSDFQPEQFLSFSSCKNRLACKLIHTARNQSILPSLPHIPFLDLSIVFFLFSENENEVFTALVNKEQLRLWDVTVEELFSCARTNSMSLFPPVIRELEEVVNSFFTSDGSDSLADQADAFDQTYPEECLHQKEAVSFNSEERPLIYVLTNTKGVNGAYTMLYPGVLKSFAEAAGHDLVIIPSSIHEVLLIPQESDLDYDEMDDTIREINQTEVPCEEQLSDHVYFYSRSSGRIFLPSGISAEIL